VLAVLLGAGPVKQLVVDHRWIMYALFVGLTLGGVPLVWRPLAERGVQYWSGSVAGFLVMAGLAVLQFTGALESGRQTDGMLLLILGGVLGAGTTMLPGGSGTFVLLLMGLYVPILSAVSRFKDAAFAGNVSGSLQEAWVLGPFAAGMGLGLVSVSLLVKWTLARFPSATYGVLLGLLVGSVVGLWPFQVGKPPVAGDMVKGRVVRPEDLSSITPDDWPVVFFAPSALQVVAAVALIAAACVLTILVTRLESRLGGGSTDGPTHDSLTS
jgi:putative membrane protein